MKITTEQIIQLEDWDEIVTKTYNRPYSFQQQDGCQSRGFVRISIPEEETFDFENDTVPEIVNHRERGVSFKAWLKRDPKTPLASDKKCVSSLRLWWNRNFYPCINIIANDLHKKGLIEKGDYIIEIDW